jgi:hypothetical protein
MSCARCVNGSQAAYRTDEASHRDRNHGLGCGVAFCATSTNYCCSTERLRFDLIDAISSATPLQTLLFDFALIA